MIRQIKKTCLKQWNPISGKPDYKAEIISFINKTSTHVYSHQESDNTHVC